MTGRSFRVFLALLALAPVVFAGRAFAQQGPLKIGIIGIGAFGSRAGMRLLWNGYPGLMVYDTHEQTPRIFTGTSFMPLFLS